MSRASKVVALKRIKALKECGTQFQNYDFGANWERVVSFLREPSFDRQMLDAFARRKCDSEYQSVQPLTPTDVDMSEANADIICDLFNYAIEINDARIPAALMARYSELVDIMEYDEEINKIEDEIYKSIGLDTGTNRYFLLFWCNIMHCHFVNRVVAYPLAQRMFPNKQWTLIATPEHTTVICLDDGSLFDLVYWGLDGRLGDYAYSKMFGNFPEHAASTAAQLDKSLGANTAINEILSRPKRVSNLR